MGLVAVVVAALLVPAAVFVSLLGAVTGAGATQTCGERSQPGAVTFGGGSDVPDAGIPPANFIPAYFAAADQPDAQLGQELGPYVLMAIHEIESGFGRSNADGVKSGINNVNGVSCCKGPFQFYDLEKSSTWRLRSPISGKPYGRDGDGDGDVDIYSNFDGMFAAGAYLYASGAPANWHAAVFAYNHDEDYVANVLSRARDFQRLVSPPGSNRPTAPAPTTVAVTDPSRSAVEVGATRFGHAGDVQAGRLGYRGAALAGTAAFAELGYAPGTNEGNARTGLLGNLPYGTKLRITYRGKSVEAVKLDVAEGRGAGGGRPPAIGIWWELADKLGLGGDDTVTIERLDGGALPQSRGPEGQRARFAPGCAAPEGIEQVVNASDGGPYGLPLSHGSYALSAPFDELRKTDKGTYNHEGTDLGAPIGTPIWATGAGKVIAAGAVGDYGNYTCIQHSQMLTSCYAHQSTMLVEVGDTVQRGQKIGEVGNTGVSTGPHLHFEMRAGPTSEAPALCPAAYVPAPADEWCVPGSLGYPS